MTVPKNTAPADELIVPAVVVVPEILTVLLKVVPPPIINEPRELLIEPEVIIELGLAF